MIDFEKLAGERISGLVPYKPGKPVKELEREMGIGSAIKLASNENPLGMSPMAMDAVRKAMPEISRYPLGDAFYLRKKLAKKLKVDENRLIFGTGSNEIIELAMRTFVKEGEHVMSYAPSFSVYGIIAQAMRSSCTWIPMTVDFEVDFDAMAADIDEDTRIIFLANPNNPTGTYFTEATLLDFLERVPEDVIVVMDEAYCEYADADDYPDTLKLLERYPNLVSMRTFSKAYGLAGLRIGYAVGHEGFIDMLNRVRQPFNVNMAAQIAAEAALDDDAFLNRTLAENKAGKKYLTERFKSLGLEWIDTQANFILVNVGSGQDVFEALMKEGVIVRYLGPGLKKYIRVSIGTREENEIFISKLSKIMENRS